jgi:hypothetical protein
MLRREPTGAAKEGRDFFMILGLPQLPWVTRTYLVLVFIFAVLILFSCLPPFSEHLEPVASEGLKTVLAALLGALSQSAVEKPPARREKIKRGGGPGSCDA